MVTIKVKAVIGSHVICFGTFWWYTVDLKNKPMVLHFSKSFFGKLLVGGEWVGGSLFSEKFCTAQNKSLEKYQNYKMG